MNKIYIFFTTIVLLLWNPLSYYLLYHNSEVYSVKPVLYAYWLLPILFIILIYLFAKNKIQEKIKNPIASVLFLFILFPLLPIVNAIVSRNEEKKQGLIFVPNAKVRYITTEFDYTAIINSIGLRDREMKIDKSDKYRILCVGDSWTYGWGVNLEDSYPKQLEKYLHSKGKNAEVINCGQAGNYTTIYAEQIARLAPVLKPDMILLGVLQGDDLAQLYENDSAFTQKQPDRIRLTTAVRMYLKSSIDNILRIVKPQQAITVRTVWGELANKMINNFSYLQKIRFKALPDSVQMLFRTGKLNPGLLSYYLDFPDRMTIFNNPCHPATIIALSKMKADIRKMKNICDSHNIKLVFVNLPLNLFTGHKVVRTPSDIFDSWFESNNKIDSMYESVAKESNLYYIELTSHFRQLKNKTNYFYRFDGHPNSKGYHEMGVYIGDHILQMF